MAIRFIRMVGIGKNLFGLEILKERDRSTLVASRLILYGTMRPDPGGSRFLATAVRARANRAKEVAEKNLRTFFAELKRRERLRGGRRCGEK